MAKLAVSSVLALGVLSLSCNDPKAQIPIPLTPGPVTPPPPPPPMRTPFAGPGTYEFVSSPGIPVKPYTLDSRYILSDDGTFVLQLANLPPLPGKYREADAIVYFDFEWNSQTAGGTGVFSGNAMTVTYNAIMSLSDFEAGVYVKNP